MNIQFNSTEEFIEELELANSAESNRDKVRDDIVRIGLVEALEENSTDIYLSSTFVSGDDIYELLVHCGRNDQYVSDGTEEYASIRESMIDSMSGMDLQIRSGRIDG